MLRRTHSALWMVMVLALGTPVTHGGTAGFELLDMLAGNDDQARARARQLLPRQDVQVVPRLVALLASDNAAVRLTAFNVLADFANQVSVPGREADRSTVTTSLMTLLTPEQPAELKELGLRLLPLVVAEGADLAPMAALLDDARLQEKARAALVETGTPGAAAVLCGHLDKATPAFACALLDGLGQMRDAASVSAMAQRMNSEHAGVRAAAARAISWTGDPRGLAGVKQVVARADDADRREALDAYRRLVRSIETSGGNWQIAIAEYLSMLQSSEPDTILAGLAGLGRIGDGTCVAPVLALVARAQGVVQAAGLDALDRMRGVDVCREIAQAYSSIPEPIRISILPILGRKQHALAMPVLKEAATGNDPVVRTAALKALGETALPDAIEPLVVASKQAESGPALASLVELGDALRRGKHAGAAGGAYLAAFGAAPVEQKDLRRRMLAGLSASPSADAFEVARQAAADAELHDLALPLLIAVGDKLVEAKDNDRAMQLYRAAMELKPDTPVLRSLADKLLRLGSPVDWAAQLGIIRHWWVVGPFDLGEQNVGWNKPYIDEPNVDLKGRYMSGKRRHEWRPVVADDERGVVNLAAVLGQVEQAIGYAYAVIDVPAATEAVLRIGADDSEKVWVNGEQVFELWAARAMTIDQDQVPVKLKAGRNEILLKVWQNTLGWEFCLRVTTADDKAVPFTQDAPR